MNITTQNTLSKSDDTFIGMSLAALGLDDVFEAESTRVPVVKTEAVVEKKPQPAPVPKKDEPRTFSPESLSRFIEVETKKRARSMESGKARLAACEFAYRCVGKGLKLYCKEELNLLRRELFSQVEYAYHELGEEEYRFAAQAWMDKVREGNAPSEPPPSAPEGIGPTLPPKFTEQKISKLIKRASVQQTDPLKMASWIFYTMVADDRYAPTERDAVVEHIKTALIAHIFMNDSVRIMDAEREAQAFIEKLLTPAPSVPMAVTTTPSQPARTPRPFRSLKPELAPRTPKVDVPTHNPGPTLSAEALAKKKADAHKARMEKQASFTKDNTAGAMKTLSLPAKSDKKEKKSKKDRGK